MADMAEFMDLAESETDISDINSDLGLRNEKDYKHGKTLMDVLCTRHTVDTVLKISVLPLLGHTTLRDIVKRLKIAKVVSDSTQNKRKIHIASLLFDML
jgi:hypothetical protein